jgi:hypothetical protein
MERTYPYPDPRWCEIEAWAGYLPMAICRGRGMMPHCHQATAEQKRAHIQILLARWAGMSEEQRRAAVYTLRQQPDRGTVMDTDGDIEGRPEEQPPRLWTSGDKDAAID